MIFNVKACCDTKQGYVANIDWEHFIILIVLIQKKAYFCQSAYKINHSCTQEKKKDISLHFGRPFVNLGIGALALELELELINAITSTSISPMDPKLSSVVPLNKGTTPKRSRDSST